MKATTLGILLGAAMLPALAQTTGDNDHDTPVGDAHVQVRIHCKTNTGKCKALPAPPAPPDAFEAGVPPAVPPVPAVPAVPPVPPPKLPPVPAEAHAACADKPAGSALAWDLGEGEVMKGICAKRHGKMVFVLRSYELNG